jgi:hypothetical protein
MEAETAPHRVSKRFSPSFETRRRARLVVADIKERLEKWQSDAAFAVALTPHSPAPVNRQWLTIVEQALNEIEHEERCLEEVLAAAPIEVERDSQVVDVRKATRLVRARFMTAKSNLALQS